MNEWQMALKKSELSSSLWSSCDELRGGMDASQYKAYVLVLLFIKYVSDKYAGQPFAPIKIPAGAGFKDMVALRTSASTTVYDPTCGSGSLLLKVGDEAGTAVTLYGQEKDAATSGVARMNMILHNNPTALVVQGNTLTNPRFKDGEALKTFDYVVANGPWPERKLPSP
jgi:type I restriction enzyme M protein